MNGQQLHQTRQNRFAVFIIALFVLILSAISTAFAWWKADSNNNAATNCFGLAQRAGVDANTSIVCAGGYLRANKWDSWLNMSLVVLGLSLLVVIISAFAVYRAYSWRANDTQ